MSKNSGSKNRKKKVKKKVEKVSFSFQKLSHGFVYYKKADFLTVDKKLKSKKTA